MAWASSNRRARLPKDWAKRRLRVLRRDGWRCQIGGPCCELVAAEVDHIVPGDDHRYANLQAVCSVCHKGKTQAESAAARARRPRERRDGEQHPGLM